MSAMDGLRVFNNAAARDSRIPAPSPGMAVVLKDTGEVLVYYGAFLGWRPPWNTKWGEITRTFLNVTQIDNDANEHVITGASTPCTTVYGRKTRITVSGVWGNAAVGATNIALRVIDFGHSPPWDTGTFGPVDRPGQIEPVRLINMSGGLVHVPVTLFVESALDYGVHTLQVTQQSSDPAGVWCIASSCPLTLTVEDIGAALPPLYAPGAV